MNPRALASRACSMEMVVRIVLSTAKLTPRARWSATNDSHSPLARARTSGGMP